MPLTTRQAAAALADAAVVALGHPHHEVVGVRPAGRRLDLAPGGVGTGERDVVVHAGVEQQLLLHDRRDGAPYGREGVVGEVVPVDQHHPPPGCQLAREQPRDRGLAGAARTHQGDAFAGRDLEVQPVECGVPRAGVAHDHAPECDSAGAVGQRGGAGPVVVAGGVEQLDEALHAGGRGVQRRHQVAEVAHRPVALQQQGQEREQPAQRQPIGRQRPDPHHHHDQHADQLGQVDQRQEQPAHPAARELSGRDRLVLPVVRHHGLVLATVGLHEYGVAQALLGDAAQRAAAATPLARHVAGERGELRRHPPERGHYDEGGERELPLQPEERAQEEQQPDDGTQPDGQLADHEALDGRDVGRQPGHRVAEPAPVLGGGRLRQHVLERVPSQVDEEPLRHPRRQVVVGTRDETAGQVQADVQQGQREQRRELRRHEHVVDEPLEEQDLRDLDRWRGGEEEEPEQQPAAERPEARPEAAYDVGDAHRRGCFDDRRLVGRRPEQGCQSGEGHVGPRFRQLVEVRGAPATSLETEDSAALVSRLAALAPQPAPGRRPWFRGSLRSHLNRRPGAWVRGRGL